LIRETAQKSKKKDFYTELTEGRESTEKGRRNTLPR
jgi:hypothetical protein